MSFFKLRFHVLVMVFVLAITSLIVLGAPGDVDASFAGNVVSAGTASPVSQIRISEKLPDGKILIAGNFSVIDGFAKKNLARLNADGTVDTTFSPVEIDGNATDPIIYSVGVYSDGKILISGDFQFINGVSFPKIARLNADGTADTAFNTLLHSKISIFQGTVYDIEVLANDQFYLAGDFILGLPANTTVHRPVYRINADGSFDNSFDTSSVLMALRKIKLLPDGKMLVAGVGTISFNHTALARLHSDGSIDFSFSGVQAKTGPNQFDFGTIIDFEILPNNQIIVGGNFTLLNGFPQGRLSRINNDGGIDLNFMGANIGANLDVQSIELVSGGQMLVGGGFDTFNGVAKPRLVRLNSDASIDNTFSYNQVNNGSINTTQSLSNSNIFIGGVAGNWDKIGILSNSGTFQNASPYIGNGGWVRTMVQQPDGKILVAGRFERANGQRLNRIVRFNLDGTLDNTFNVTQIPASLTIRRLVLQPDGKILVGSPTAFPYRLNADGTLDTGFSIDLGVGPTQQNDLAVLPNGKILIGGVFNTGFGIAKKIIRLESNGGMDSTFTTPTINGTINRLILLNNGKMLIAGEFTQIGTSLRSRIALLNADGTLNTDFNPIGGANATINDIALQPDGKVVIVGDFTALAGSNNYQYVGRLNADGTLDTSFIQQANAPLQTVRLQPDGKIVIGGFMSSVGGIQRNGLARLNSNGTVDSTFQTGTGANSQVWEVLIQTDGKIMAGGKFTRFNGMDRIGLVRLLNSASGATEFDFDGDGKADISVFRPSTNRWYEVLSGNSSIVEKDFGLAGDVIAPADFDGDGKTDIAIFRPSSGDWWYLSSVSNAQINVRFGLNGDIPRPSDFDGDGKADFIVYRPSNNVWYRFGSTGQTSIMAFGLAGDKPLVGDFDGDGKGDVAIYRPSTGDWWYAESSNNNQHRVEHWGISTDIPVPADYDGDGKTDFAVFRPSTGVWYIRNSNNGSALINTFGLPEDKPIAADYDGDGKADIAVFRPSTGIWYILKSTAGFSAFQFGIATDIPVQNAFLQ